MASDSGPRTISPLTTVKRIFAGHTLAPAVDSLAMRREQQNAATRGAPETRLKKMNERHLNLAQRDGFNLHNFRASAFGRRASANTQPASLSQFGFLTSPPASKDLAEARSPMAEA